MAELARVPMNRASELAKVPTRISGKDLGSAARRANPSVMKIGITYDLKTSQPLIPACRTTRSIRQPAHT